MSSVNYKTHQEGQNKISTLTWTVPNFIKQLENTGVRELRTGKTKNVNVGGSIFHLKMRFGGHDNNIIDIYYLSIYPVYLKSELTVYYEHHSKGYQGRSIAKEEYHTIERNQWQHLATLLKRDITSDNNYLLNNGSFQLEFQFILPNDNYNELDKDNTSDVSTVNRAQLCDDFHDILNNSLFSDITIKSADEEDFKVHKVVLACRSPVLRAHFEHNTTECTTNIVKSPFESDILREVLIFIYSSEAPNVDEISESLLAAAEYYQLAGLKTLCEKALHKQLSVENAIETLQIADLHNASTLKQKTLEFIKGGQANLITKTQGWANLKSGELIKSIYEYTHAEEVEVDITYINQD